MARSAGIIDTLLGQTRPDREWRLAELAISRPDLHARVRALLEADREATRVGFMQVKSRAGEEPHANAALRPDTRLGPYLVVRELGAGGMGEVWLARRDDGLYDGEVAIKTLHPFFAPRRDARSLPARGTAARQAHASQHRAAAGRGRRGRCRLPRARVRAWRSDRSLL